MDWLKTALKAGGMAGIPGLREYNRYQNIQALKPKGFEPQVHTGPPKEYFKEMPNNSQKFSAKGLLDTAYDTVSDAYRELKAENDAMQEAERYFYENRASQSFNPWMAPFLFPLLKHPRKSKQL